MVQIVLLHSGKTTGISEQRYIGITDESLSEEGVSELQDRFGEGFYPFLSAVCSSPMKRCLETAKILYPGFPPTVMPGFKPRSYGRYEGKSYIDLKDDAPYQSWVRSIGKLPFPDGEPESEAKARYLSTFDDLAHRLRPTINSNTALRIGLVLHREIITTILSERLPLKENPLKYQLKNGEYFTVNLTETGIDLVGKNTVKA